MIVFTCMKERMRKIVSIVIIALLLAPHFVIAAKTIHDAEGFLGQTVQETGLPTADVETSTATIVKGALGAVGIVFFVLMVYGGFLWMTDRGSDEQAKKAKDIIQAAIIGIILIVAAYAMTNYIFGRLNQ